MQPQEAVREFHEFFNLPVRWGPTEIPESELQFRRKLVTEEYDEFMEALEGSDLEHQLKEAADLVYVLYGWDQHVGNLLARVFAEVHRSNMTKLWDCEDCTNGLALGGYYGDVIDCPTCEGSGKYAKYREDGKVLKPPTYTPPDLSWIHDQ